MSDCSEATFNAFELCEICVSTFGRLNNTAKTFFTQFSDFSKEVHIDRYLLHVRKAKFFIQKPKMVILIGTPKNGQFWGGGQVTEILNHKNKDQISGSQTVVNFGDFTYFFSLGLFLNTYQYCGLVL